MSIDHKAIWHALPSPGLVLDSAGCVQEINGAAEDFLGVSERGLRNKPLAAWVGEDSRLADLVRQARQDRAPVSEYSVEFFWPETPPRMVDLFAVPVDEGATLLLIHPRASAERMSGQLASRDAVRSVTGMAAMLAHEIKNPLAGISGAAQLLEMNVALQDQEICALIREECLRIEKLVAQMEAFGDRGLLRRRPVNVHDVLDRAVKAAKAGFASHVRFAEEYDPSLPEMSGDADQLIQVMLNLLKNAAEAVPQAGGSIVLKTGYRAGMKVRTGQGTSENLPLQIEIVDNGGGVPEELRAHLFEPFVTSKAAGTGLGLALVSKIIADHGGVISCESVPGSTTFRLLLPMAGAVEVERAAENAA